MLALNVCSLDCRVTVPPLGAAQQPRRLPEGWAAALGLAGTGAGAGDSWPEADVAVFEAGLARFGKHFDDTLAVVRPPQPLRGLPACFGRRPLQILRLWCGSCGRCAGVWAVRA